MKLEVKMEIDLVEDDKVSQEIILENIEEYCWAMDNQVSDINIANVSCVEETTPKHAKEKQDE